MPKSYEPYTSYPEHDHEIYRDVFDGRTDRVAAHINAGVNIYQKTKFSLATPLFFAISASHIEIIDLLLNIYQSDLNFIDTYFRTHNVNDKLCLKQPILIAYGANEIKLVEDLYAKYVLRCKPSVSSNSSGLIVLLKENNFTPKRVLHFMRQSELGKMFVLQLIQIVLHNGQLYLNGCNNLGDSLVKVITINGIFRALQKLIKLGCDYNAVELSRLAMRSGQILFLNEMMKTFKININAVIPNEIDLFNLIGAGEWQMCEFVIAKLIVMNGFGDNVGFLWKTTLDMCSDRYNGGTLYHYAIICDQIEFVQKYLSYGPNLKLRNREGCIPIYHAFHSVKYKKFVYDMIDEDKELLEMPANSTKYALHLMVEKNWCDVFENILRKYPQARNVFFNNTEATFSAINYAICQKYIEIVKFIIGMYRDEIKHGDLYSFLHTAVRANSNEIVEYILTQAKFDLCRPTQKGENLLILALSNRNIDIYLALIDNNQRTDWNLHDIKDEENNSLLRYTIWSRDYFQDVQTYEKFNVAFEEFLRAGLEFNNIATISGQNLVHHCALMGNDRILQTLLTLKLDVELWDAEENLPIHYATNLATFQLLNEYTGGRQINIKNRNSGNTPLHILMMKRFETDLPTDLLEYMLQNGADVNAINNLQQTPLHLVQIEDWCRILLQNGGNINAVDNEENTPVHSAFLRSHLTVAMFLFEQDINLNAVNSSGFNYLAGLLKQQFTVLHKLCPNIMRSDNEKIIKLISTYCNSCNEKGTPLLIESMYSNELICKMILNEPNCNVNIRDKISHRTAIHATAMYNKFELIACLIELGANINDRDSNANTPLHYSCQFFHNHAVDFLKYGANINAENNNGETPFHCVALADLHGDTVCQMLQSGANLKAKNSDGKMPYDLLRDDLKQIFKIFL